jgi:hypothetical protein
VCIYIYIYIYIYIGFPIVETLEPLNLQRFEKFWEAGSCELSALLHINYIEGKRCYLPPSQFRNLSFRIHFILMCIHSAIYIPTIAVAASKLGMYPMLCVQFLSSWWWAEKPPETCRALTVIKNVVERCNLLVVLNIYIYTCLCFLFFYKRFPV